MYAIRSYYGCHAQRAAPEFGGRLQVIRPAVDDEAAEFAPVHVFSIPHSHSERKTGDDGVR